MLAVFKADYVTGSQDLNQVPAIMRMRLKRLRFPMAQFHLLTLSIEKLHIMTESSHI